MLSLTHTLIIDRVAVIKEDYLLDVILCSVNIVWIIFTHFNIVLFNYLEIFSLFMITNLKIQIG